MEWIQRLRAQSRALHETAHALPFFHALWRHELPLESFVTQLRCLAVVHGALEKFLAAHGFNEPFCALLDGHRPKLPLLLQDLELYRERWVPNVLPAVEGALRIADRILVLSQENTTALLGFFYTLEGSTQGGRVMEPHLRKNFSLPEGQGTSFFCCYGEATSARWHNFLDVLGHSLKDDEAAQETVITASEELFRALIDVYRALFPFQDNQLGHHVVSLNPEAGQHPVPSDQRELEAACRAADRCWKAFPYFALRYGERGTRFAASDAAWLVTLCHGDVRALIDQVFWLSQVLSVRGMPSWLLENQLRMLHEELVSSCPENRASYDRLLLAADALRSRRQAMMSEERIMALARETAQRFPQEGDLPWASLCQVLAAAAADEAAGMQGALDTVLTWLRSLVGEGTLATDAMEAFLKQEVRSHP